MNIPLGIELIEENKIDIDFILGHMDSNPLDFY